MKLEQLVGDRFKERPSDCVIDSHALMIRGGYMKNMANGIFSQFPPLGSEASGRAGSIAAGGASGQSVGGVRSF